MTYSHSKDHALNQRTISNPEAIDSLMDGLELLLTDPRRASQALTILDHMRRDYTKLDLRSATEVTQYLNTYEGQYKQLVNGK